MSDKIDLTTQSNIQFGSNGNNNTGDGESTPTILDFLTGYASLQQKNIVDAQFNILNGYISSLISGVRLGTGANNKIYNDITDLNTLFQSGNYSFIYDDSAGAITAPSNSPVVNQSYTLTVQTRNETDGTDSRTAGVMFKLATQTATVDGVRITRQGSFDGSSFNWSDWRIERGQKFIDGYSYKFGEDCIIESNENGVLYSNRWISVKNTANQGNNPQNIIDTTPYDYFNDNWRREKISIRAITVSQNSNWEIYAEILASGVLTNITARFFSVSDSARSYRWDELKILNGTTPEQNLLNSSELYSTKNNLQFLSNLEPIVTELNDSDNDSIILSNPRSTTIFTPKEAIVMKINQNTVLNFNCTISDVIPNSSIKNV